MRILFVPAFINQHGGLEENLEALVQVALEDGHDAAILTARGVRDDATIKQSLSVPFLSAQEFWQRTLFGRAMTLAAAVRHVLAKRRLPPSPDQIELGRTRSSPYVERYWRKAGVKCVENFDILHLVGKPKDFLTQAALTAHQHSTPVVYTEVAQVNEEYAGTRAHQLFRNHSNVCSEITVYCERHARDIRSHFAYRGNTTVIEQWAFKTEKELLNLARERNGNEITLGTLSRLSPEKGLPIVLRAFAHAQAGLKNLRLRVGGAGALREDLLDLARELRINVDFPGYVEDKIAFYKTLDIFIVASEEEGGPITGVEAMAASLPIITTPVGAMPERLQNQEAALFFPVGSVEDLAQAIKILSGDFAHRTQLGQAARRSYMARNNASLNRSKLTHLWKRFSVA